MATELACDWHTVNDAVTTYGEALLEADRKRLNQTSAIGLDETSFVRLGPFKQTSFATTVADVENHQIIDILPSREYVEVAGWIAAQPAPWKERIRYGALDMSTTYAAVYSVVFLSLSSAYPLMVQSAKKLTKIASEYDKELIDGLHAVGFRTDIGEDATGWQMKYFRRGGGYYINVGCSELIADGKVRVVQYDDIVGFERSGLRYVDASKQHFDACIFATGYLDQQAGVRAHFGDAVADKVGSIWGFDENGETKNVWKPTPQESLWFAMGSLTACRIYSKFLARQIWARSGSDRLVH